jgi:hypothetical protein
VLRKKLTNVGFDAPSVAERRPFGLAALARYPIAPPGCPALGGPVGRRARHDAIVVSLVVTTRKPG